MNLRVNYKYFNTIIIGSGGSGLMAAVSLVKNKVDDIAIISKVLPTSSHTVAAKGGINAALGNKGDDDWRWHAYDTIKSSDYLADEDSVNFMCENAPKSIIELERMGLAFSRFEDGKIYQRAYGGQSKNFGKGGVAHRACPAKDNTGHSMLNTLYQKAIENNVKFFNEFFLTDLVIQDDKCYGAVTLDLNQGEICVFRAENIIIATGGGGQIYKNSTTSNVCTGDGGGSVLRSGLQLQDMEFVQFHPTGLYSNSILVTEAARGEGGYLLNGKNERFMEKYSPDFVDLAPRDQVARAISEEITMGNGAGDNKDHVYLKIDHLGSENIKNKLPGLVNLVKSFAGIDATTDLIPVVPVAHYTMGGIPTNNNCQVHYKKDKKEIIVDGLFAIGEAACISVHGANRMGCNSLLDLVVFGNMVGGFIGKNGNNESFSKDSSLFDSKIERINSILKVEFNEKFNISEIKLEIQGVMEKYAGIFRTESSLDEGLSKLKELANKFKFFGVKNKSLFFNDELVSYLEVENLLLQSLVTIYSALQRKESRGAHYRNDFPIKDDNWRFHSLVSVDLQKVEFKFDKKSVR